MQSPSDEGASPKNAEDPKETTGGEGGSEASEAGRVKARQTASSNINSLSGRSEGSSGAEDSVSEAIAPIPDVPPKTSFSDDSDEDVAFHPDRGLTRLELKADDFPPLGRAPGEGRRGVNRVELDMTGIDLPPRREPDPRRGLTKVELHDPDFLDLERKKRTESRAEEPTRTTEVGDTPPPAAPTTPAVPEGARTNRVEFRDSARPPEPSPVQKGKAEPRRVEIPHEIDTLLGIKDDGPLKEDSGSYLPPFARTPTSPPKVLPASQPEPEARAQAAERQAAIPRPSESFHGRPQPSPSTEVNPPARPTTDTRNGEHRSPSTESRASASSPASVVAPPIVEPRPAQRKEEPSRSATGLDSMSDGHRSPTINTPVQEAATPPPEPQPDDKTTKIVGNRSRKWLAWFLGKPAHIEGVVTPVPTLEPNTTQVTLREMVPATAYARVLFSNERGRHHYVVIEPPMDERETRSLQFIKEVLLRTLDTELEIVERSVADESLQLLDEQVKKVVRDYRMDLSETSLRRLSYYLRRDFTGYGPVDVMMHDPDIEDISCDGPGTNVFLYHRRYGSMESNVMFPAADELDGFVIRMAQRSGKQITIADPLLDSSLPDGSRLQATLGREVTDNGSTFTIRRFRDNPLSPIDLVRMGTMSADLLAYCWIIVQFGANVMLAGGTASGKTTTLNTISLFIPRQAKIVSIEDTREINLPHKNWVRSVTRGGSRGNDLKRVDMFDLLTAALRQRPEYILVGEVRGKEATVAFQAMATGHTVLGTIHADSPRSVVYRLESEPINIPRIVIQSLDVILMQALLTVGGRRQRRIQEVAEIVGIDPASKELLTHGVFMRNPTNDQLHYTGRSYKLQRIAQRNNWTPKQLEGEMKRRAQIVNALVAMPEVTFEEIGRLFSLYENRPDAVEAELERLGSRGKAEGTQ